MKKQYIVRKYILAENLTEVIKLDSKTPVHDAWVDKDWEGVKTDLGFKVDEKNTTKKKAVQVEEE